MSYLKEANAIFEEMVENRRHLHRNPETGYDLPETTKYVKKQLESYGYETESIIENSLITTVGNGNGKTLLLRADMDALPIEEKSGEDFASEKTGFSHTCGHDFHTAVMLGVAKILKEHEDELEGTVKFVFQPAEELLTGAKTMIDAGLLENPKVDAALGAHVNPMLPKGIGFNDDISMTGANNYRIKVKGVGSHGAMPENGIDPVYIATKIIQGFQELITKEIYFGDSAVITTGGFKSAGAVNVIPAEVELEGTMRTFNNETRSYLKERMPEMAQKIAEAYRGEVEFEFLSDAPPFQNNKELVDQVRAYADEVLDGKFETYDVPSSGGSEDYAFVSQEVPTAYFYLGMRENENDEAYPVHHPKVRMNEDLLAPGAAVFAEAATRWLKKNK